MAREQFSFAVPFRVRTSEVDYQGIAFNGHYLTWFDVALWEYFKALPWDLRAQVKETNTDFHTVKAVVEFKRPVRLDDDIEVHVRTARVGRSSVSFALEIHPPGTEDLIARGEVIWVNTDQAAHASAPVPEALRAKLEARDGHAWGA